MLLCFTLSSGVVNVDTGINTGTPQSSPQPFEVPPASCNPVGPPGACTAGNSCANGGCCLKGNAVAGSRLGCTGCPTCCRVKNPTFNKQCGLSTVLILDNTISLDPYCSSVKPAVASFVNGLNNIVNAGGSAKLGVIKFQQTPTVVWDMTECNAAFLTQVQSWVGTATTNGKSDLLPLQCALTPSPFAGNSVTAVFPAGQTVYGYCTHTGYTNWAGALLMALQWPWAGVPVPDIYIWFTDGYPEYSGDYVPQTICDAACYDQTNTFFSDLCNPLSKCPLSNGATGLTNLWLTVATPQVSARWLV